MHDGWVSIYFVGQILNDEIAGLKPQANDLVVVPENMIVPDDPPFLVYKMKFLRNPSIIRSGGYGMGFLEMFKGSLVAQWFGLPLPMTESEVSGSNVVTGQMDPQPNTREVKVSYVAEDLPKFYRYVRFYDEIVRLSGSEVVISPKGGVTFLVELDAANATLAFSYALCHNADNFCRKIARDICKGRFDNEDWYEVKNVNPKLGVVENIRDALYNALFMANEVVTEGAVFSSMSERTNNYELEQLFERIDEK